MFSFLDCWLLQWKGVWKNIWCDGHDRYYRVRLGLCNVLDVSRLVVIQDDCVWYLCVMRMFLVIYV